MNEERFENAKYLFEPFNGKVFSENTEGTFRESLGIEKSVVSCITESLATGAITGVMAGALVYIYLAQHQQINHSFLSLLAIAFGLASISYGAPLDVPFSVGISIAVIISLLVFIVKVKKRIRNNSYRDYVSAWNMNDYGKRVAGLILPPVIRFMRTSGSWSETKQDALVDYVKVLHGFSDAFLNYWIDIAKTRSLDELDLHIKQMIAILESGNTIPLISNKNLYKKADHLIELYSNKVIKEHEHRKLSKDEYDYKRNWKKIDIVIKGLIQIEKGQNKIEIERRRKTEKIVAQYASKKNKEARDIRKNVEKSTTVADIGSSDSEPIE